MLISMNFLKRNRRTEWIWKRMKSRNWSRFQSCHRFQQCGASNLEEDLQAHRPVSTERVYRAGPGEQGDVAKRLCVGRSEQSLCL